MNDEMQKMMIMLMIIPVLSLVQKYLDKGKREWYNLLMVVIVMWELFRWKCMWVYVQCVGSYLLTVNYQRKWRGTVMMFNFSLLSMLHVYNQVYYYKEWRIDVSGCVMLLLQKTTAFAYQYSDSTLPIESLNSKQKLSLIHTMPSFIQYIHYLLFLPTLLVGPTFDYHHFHLYISNIKHIPNSYQQIIKQYLYSFILIFIYQLMQSYYHLDYLFTQQFKLQSFPYRLFIVMIIVAETQKWKYYAAWTFNRVATVACGLAYNINNNNENNNENYKWDNSNNVNILEIESAECMRTMISNWNISTHLWLKNHVYIRLCQMGCSNAKLVTFLVSAFWHGFYPGYYIAFILLSLFNSTLIIIRQLSISFIPKPILYFSSWLITRLMMPYFAAGFLILDFQSTLLFYQNTGIYFFSFCITLFLTLNIIYKKKLKLKS